MMDRWNLLIFFFFSNFSIFFSLKTHFGWRKHFFDKNVLPRTFTVYQKKKELLKTGDYSDNLPMMDRWNLLIFFFFQTFRFFFTQNSFWLEKTLFWQKRFTKNIHSLPKKKKSFSKQEIIQIIFQWWIEEICWFSSFFQTFRFFFHSKLILVGENTFLTKTFYQEHSQFTKKKKELLKTGDYSDNLPMMDRLKFVDFLLFFKVFRFFFSLKTHFGWRKHFFDKNVLPRTFTVYQKKKKELLKTGDYSDNLPMMDRWNLLIFLLFFKLFDFFFTQNSFWLEKTLFWQKRFTKNIHSLPKKKKELLKTGDYSDNLPMMDRWNLLIFFFFSNFSIFFHSKLILAGEKHFFDKNVLARTFTVYQKKKSFSKQEIIQIIFQWWIDEICVIFFFFSSFSIFFPLKTHFGWRKHFFEQKRFSKNIHSLPKKKKELLKTGDYSDNLPMMDRWNLLIFFFFSNFSIFFTQNSFWLEKTLFWQKRFTKNIQSLPKKKKSFSKTGDYSDNLPMMDRWNLLIFFFFQVFRFFFHSKLILVGENTFLTKTFYQEHSQFTKKKKRASQNRRIFR